MIKNEPFSTQHFTVLGHEGRLAQVFENLLSNAISFSPLNSQITIILTADKQFIQIDVDDEGPGLTKGSEKKIFDRFYSDRPENEKFGTHSGLGLSISKKIIEAHRGILSGTNRKNKTGRSLGARFTVRLPIY